MGKPGQEPEQQAPESMLFIHIIQPATDQSGFKVRLWVFVESTVPSSGGLIISVTRGPRVRTLGFLTQLPGDRCYRRQWVEGLKSKVNLKQMKYLLVRLKDLAFPPTPPFPVFVQGWHRGYWLRSGESYAYGLRIRCIFQWYKLYMWIHLGSFRGY